MFNSIDVAVVAKGYGIDKCFMFCINTVNVLSMYLLKQDSFKKNVLDHQVPINIRFKDEGCLEFASYFLNIFSNVKQYENHRILQCMKQQVSPDRIQNLINTIKTDAKNSEYIQVFVIVDKQWLSKSKNTLLLTVSFPDQRRCDILINNNIKKFKSACNEGRKIWFVNLKKSNFSGRTILLFTDKSIAMIEIEHQFWNEAWSKHFHVYQQIIDNSYVLESVRDTQNIECTGYKQFLKHCNHKWSLHCLQSKNMNLFIKQEYSCALNQIKVILDTRVYPIRWFCPKCENILKRLSMDHAKCSVCRKTIQRCNISKKQLMGKFICKYY